MVQAALHWASSRGFPLFALRALVDAAPTTTKAAHVKIANLIAHTPMLEGGQSGVNNYGVFCDSLTTR